MDSKDTASPKTDGAGFRDVPVALVVSVGRARLPVGELMALDRDAVLRLDTRIDEPVKLMAGGRVVAMGELQELEGDGEGQLAVRITELKPATGEDPV